MIGIHEGNADIPSLAERHSSFVGKRVLTSLEFYIDILTYLLKIDGKRSTDAVVNAKVMAIKEKNNCDHYKSLLTHLLKTDRQIKRAEDSFLIKTPKHRKKEFSNLPKMLTALNSAHKRYHFLLNVDFCGDRKRYYSAYERIKKDLHPANFLFERIFDYQWFSGLATDQPWGPYQLTTGINQNTCAYCNRQFNTTLIKVDGKKVARPELDHFLPKAKHPLLALSFYNLIPSCSVCNSSIKGSQEISYDKHLSPYAINKNHALMRFTYVPQSYAASVGLTEELDIQVAYNGDPADTQLQTLVDGNIELFCLKELYMTHRDLIREIIQKRHTTNDRYIQMTQKTFNRLKLSHEDAYRLAFGNYFVEKDFHKRPLSKLTKDIAYELRILPKFKKPI